MFKPPITASGKSHKHTFAHLVVNTHLVKGLLFAFTYWEDNLSVQELIMAEGWTWLIFLTTGKLGEKGEISFQISQEFYAVPHFSWLKRGK